MKSINIFVILIACLITTTQLQAKAFSVVDNTKLLSEIAIEQGKVLSTNSIARASFYIDSSYQSQARLLCPPASAPGNVINKAAGPKGQLIEDEDTNNTFNQECITIGGEIDRVRERAYGSGEMYYLNTNETIVSYKGNSPRLGDFTYEIKYDKLTANTIKESKIVSEKGVFANGVDLENQYIHLVNHTFTNRGRDYKRAAVNTYSRVDNSYISADWGGLKNARVYARANFELHDVKTFIQAHEITEASEPAVFLH